MYQLYVKQKIDAGLADVRAGPTLPHEDVKLELLRDDADQVYFPAPWKTGELPGAFADDPRPAGSG